jgi:hypothetical protein
MRPAASPGRSSTIVGEHDERIVLRERPPVDDVNGRMAVSDEARAGAGSVITFDNPRAVAAAETTDSARCMAMGS